MSRPLVVVYSWTGTSRLLAHTLASRRGWALGEIHDAVPARNAWRCVLDTLLRREPPIDYTGPDPAEHDPVLLVSPIWAWHLAGPMRSFVSRWRTSLRRVVVVSVMDASGAGGAVKEVTRLLGRPPRLDEAFLSATVADGRCSAKLDTLGRAVDAMAGPKVSINHGAVKEAA